MRKYVPFSMIALSSSILTLGVYKAFEKPVTVQWGDDLGRSQYAGYVERMETSNRFTNYATAPTNFTDAAAIVTPSVVNIRTLEVSDPGFWGGGTIKGNTGSGVIVSADGYIVTNNHVVENSSDLKVTLADKRQYKGKIVGRDPNTDIALVKIDVENLPFVQFGNSDSVRVGEWVLAVGNPFNLASTVTAGIVSAKSRNINILGGGASIESFIQTDAAVNPGNSGGALVNTQGDLIGINTAIITESGNYEGYSFAVPSILVQKIVKDLREFGEVKRGFLGVGIEDLSPESAEDAGMRNAYGVLVNRVNINSGAFDAGLQEGDIIIAINGMDIKGTSELQEFVGRYRPGDKLKIDFWRAEKRRQLLVELKDQNNNRVASASSESQTESLENYYGVKFRTLSPSEKRRYNMAGLVVVSVERGSLVGDTHMQAGFILNSINGAAVETPQDAFEAIRSARSTVSMDGFYPGEPDLYSYRFKVQ